MSKGKKGFTLIEIVIVVVIIGILILIGLGLNRNQISTLKSRNLIENLQGDRDQAFMQNLNSSYINGKQYQWMQIALNKTENSITLDYLQDPNASTSNNTEKSESKSEQSLSDSTNTKSIYQSILATDTKWRIIGLTWDGTPIEEVSLLSKPFSSSCSIKDVRKKLEVGLEVSSKQVCFEISDQYCRLRQVDCNPAKSETEKNL